MTFPVDDQLLGPRSWGVRKSTAGIIFHTTEYADFTRASAVACARDQAKRLPDGGWAQPGSYNFIVYDGGVLLSVPYLEGSGGVNPSSASWAPERFPWLKQLLPAAAYADPTMHHLQIAFSGKTAAILLGRMPANMWETAAKLINWVEAAAWGADNVIVSSHLNWQSNRSDPGAGTADKIVALANKPAQPAPLDYKALYTAEVVKVGSLTTKLTAERKRIATIKTKTATFAADIAND
jgi:hypothetical protein